MNTRITTAILCTLAACSVATAADEGGWWNPGWRFRTTAARAASATSSPPPVPLLNVLRVCDVPEVLGMLAAR